LIGTVARLVPQKNPFLFLEAAALVLRNQPSTRFVWCGSGEMLSDAKQRAHELGIDGVCRFLGHREDPQHIMAALDVFWLPSNYEGLPSVLIEAMALNVPIIATDVVGTRDMLRSGAGLSIPPSNAQALAEATIALLGQPKMREELTRTAAALARDRWSVERMVGQTGKLYEELASKGRLGQRLDSQQHVM
jgi:glycosyltransferase involved in cell wall biosynthesis